MNCRHFQDKLFEYVEGSLSAEEMAAAQQHLAGCTACRKPVRQEQKLAQALSDRLRQTGESLTLRPEIMRNVLAASRATRPARESFSILWMRWLRLASIPVSLLLIIAFLLAAHFSATRTGERTSTPVATHVSTAMATDRQQPEASVELSYRLPVHEFHQEGNLVMDAFVDESVVANGTIPSGSPKNLPQKFEMKTPL